MANSTPRTPIYANNLTSRKI